MVQIVILIVVKVRGAASKLDMRYYQFVIVLLSCFFAASAQELTTGTIVDSIQINNSNDSFALYLPNSFDASKPSPIVFIFEPAARSKIGIKPFIESSEAHGYILICSNNAKNGPYNTNFDIANRLFTHVFSTYSINENEVYLAGFSGGARLATAIAALTNKSAGVIACGAGFSHIPDHRPSTQSFAYVGMCGDRDFNYQEMVGVKSYLEKLNFTNTLFTYPGYHDWPTSNKLKQAFDWLELQAHQSKRKVLSTEKLMSYYKSDYERARTFEKKQHRLREALIYERMLAGYKGLFEMDSIQSKYDVLLKSKEVSLANKQLMEALSEESILNSKFRKRFASDINNPKANSLDWWNKHLRKLYKRTKKANLENEKMIDRVKNNIGVMTWSRQNPNLYKTSQEQKKFCKGLSQLMNTIFKE